MNHQNNSTGHENDQNDNIIAETVSHSTQNPHSTQNWMTGWCGYRYIYPPYRPWRVHLYDTPPMLPATQREKNIGCTLHSHLTRTLSYEVVSRHFVTLRTYIYPPVGGRSDCRHYEFSGVFRAEVSSVTATRR